MNFSQSFTIVNTKSTKKIRVHPQQFAPIVRGPRLSAFYYGTRISTDAADLRGILRALCENLFVTL